MNDVTLILSSVKARWLNSFLSVLLTAFGVMLALILVQFGHHIQNRLSADSQGIDIVVGAKGSPLQLILSSVYHIDVPTGNIPYDQAERWMKNSQIKTAIPLALGDNWRGHRIVGTTLDYMSHYQASLINGRSWTKPFEAVVGASVGLQTGDSFEGAHGLMPGGHAHGDKSYVVTGVMAPTGTILDRLILTSLDSVLNIHGLDGVEYPDHAHNHSHDDDSDHAHNGGSEPEITALLLTTKSPIATINLPRMINRNSALQAATPALEIARLTSMLGLGTQSFAALSVVLIAIAALSIFAGLAGGLENRIGDLAVLRAIGYSKRRIFKIIACEGMIIISCGLALGLIMGLGGFTILSQTITPLQASGAAVMLSADMVLIVVSVAVAGFLAAALPAYRASAIDVARALSRNA